jgi:hypothetical protein
MRILRQDGGRTHRRDPCLLSSRSRLRVDLRHQGGDAAASLFGRQVLPAGQRIEGRDLRRGVLQRMEVLPAVTGRVLLRAVEPVALELFLAEKRPGPASPL